MDEVRRNWTTYLPVLIVVVLVTISAFQFYPQRLQKVLGIDDVSREDISSMSLGIGTYYENEEGRITQEWFSREDITDDAFIEEVLSLLSNHSMRTRIGQPPYYYRVDPEKPSTIEIRISCGTEHAFIIIHHNEKMVSVRG